MHGRVRETPYSLTLTAMGNELHTESVRSDSERFTPNKYRLNHN